MVCPAGRRACLCACAWGAARAATTEGGGERGGGRPSPRSQSPGRLLGEPGNAALLPLPPRAVVTPRPHRALPCLQPAGLPVRPDAASRGSRSQLRGGRGNECGGGTSPGAGLEERESGRGSGPGAELRCPQTRLSAVRRAVHLCHAQPWQVLQAALVLPPRMVSL